RLHRSGHAQQTTLPLTLAPPCCLPMAQSLPTKRATRTETSLPTSGISSHPILMATTTTEPGHKSPPWLLIMGLSFSHLRYCPTVASLWRVENTTNLVEVLPTWEPF